MHNPIYLDNNSTTPVDPKVLEAMLPYFTTCFGNPSNTSHRFGSEAADAVERARKQVATLIGAEPAEIVFTSGATESNNLAILGLARTNAGRANHIITVASEHKAVLEPCRQLEREGWRVTYLPVDKFGSVDAVAVEAAISPTTLLVSVMTANNEVGTLQPVAEIGQICRERGILFHSDAVQAIGKIKVDVDELVVDMLSMSAHKVYGPKGVGALFIRRGCAKFLNPLMHGGGQESGLRSGTLAVPGIVGFGVACERALQQLPQEPLRLGDLRERLKNRFLDALPDAVAHGHPTVHLPGLLNVGFPGVDGDALIQLVQTVAVSQGSSCSDSSFEPSHVLTAMGISDELAIASLRFGVGRFNTQLEIDRAAEDVIAAVLRLRQISKLAH